MTWLFCIGVLAIMGPKAVLGCSSWENCGYEFTASSTPASVRSPCHPSAYPISMNCTLSMLPANLTFTQMTFSSFEMESWQDFLKFEGPENFILFANATTNEMIVTGYPNGTIKGQFMSDDTKGYSGYNFSTASVTAIQLLAQYNGYGNDSSQVMRSPMYLTSADNTNGNVLDVLAINFASANQTPGDAWKEYVRLVGRTNIINTSDVTATGFKIQWTAIEGSVSYSVSIRDSAMKYHVRNEAVSQSSYVASSLPSGTRFTIEVVFNNKKGISETVTANAKTNEDSVKNIQVAESTNSSVTFTWDTLVGATGYQVQVGQIPETVPQSSNPTYKVTSRLPGTVVLIQIISTFENRSGDPVEENGWTLPADVIDLKVPDDAAETSFTPTWTRRQDDKYILTLIYSNGSEQWRNTSAEPNAVYSAKPGQKYTLSIRAENPVGGLSENPDEFKFQTPMTSPTVTVGTVSSHNFRLTWDRIPEASKYEYNCTNSANGPTTTDETEAWILYNVNPETTYRCTVAAVSNDEIKSSFKAIPVTTNKDPCEPTPCLNEGTCERRTNDFNCICKNGYEGKACQDVKDYCEKGGQKAKCKDNTNCTNDPQLERAVCRCIDGYKGDPLAGCIAYCESWTWPAGEDRRFELSFVSAYVGVTVYSNEKCPADGRSRGSATCTNTAGKPSFQSRVYTECSATVTSVVPSPKVSSNATENDIIVQTADLQVVTSGDSNKLPVVEVAKVSQFIESVSEKAATEKNPVSYDILVNIANTADNLIKSNSLDSPVPNPSPSPSPETPASNSSVPTSTTTTTTTTPAVSTTTVSREEQSRRIKSRILKSLNSLANHVEIPENKNDVVLITSTMVLKVENAPTDQNTEFSPVVPKSTDSGIDNTTQPVTIKVPASALRRAQSTNSSIVRVSFFLHKQATLFPSNKGTPGMIVAANVGDGKPLDNLPEPVTLQFDYRGPTGVINETSPFERTVNYSICSYWDVSKGDWDERGVFWQLKNVSKTTECASNHLTNFALLVAKDELEPNIALETISLIGLSLSLLGLLLTVIIHAIKEDVRKRRPTRILFHICINLMISTIIFIVGIERNDNKAECTIIAAFMQYFYLTSWMWMTIYAYDMYRSLVMVFGGGKSFYMTKCTAVGYGIPLLLTVIDVGVTVGYLDPRYKPKGVLDREDGVYNELDKVVLRKSAYVAENICWIHEYSLYLGFLVPVGIMLVFNIFVYSMVMKTLFQRGKALQSSAKKTSLKDSVFISITLVASTGLAWVFGYLMLLSSDQYYLTVMSWIFALLNSVQGLVIFLSTCVRNENMRKIWLIPLSSCCSSAGTKIRLISPKSDRMDISNTKSTNESSSFTSSGTKGTTVNAVSMKPLESESVI